MTHNYREEFQQETASKSKKAILSGFIALFSLCLMAWNSTEAAIAGDIEVHGLYSIEKDEFIDLLGFKQGVQLDKEIVREGIKRAFLKGIFEDISVEVSEGATHDIVVNVREKEFIKKVHIDGNFRISRKKIAELFLLKEDQVMRYDLIPRAKEELKENFSLYGFPDAMIDVKVVEDKEPYRANIYVVIDAGPPLLIKTIHIVGTDLDLEGSLKTSPGDVYDQNSIKNDLNRIAEHLKKQGYYKPAIGPYYYRDGELEIAVIPGKKLTIAIEGNKAISQKNLMKEVPFFEIKTFNDEVVSEAIDRMLFLYHEDGYAYAQIAPVISSDEGAVHIDFFVFEGKKYEIKDIQFVAAGLSHKKLQEVMNLKKNGVYNPDLLQKDRDALKEIYGALGYLEAEVKEFEIKTDEKDDKVEIRISIHEGERTKISVIDIVGVEADMKEKLIEVAGLKPGDPYNEIDISDSRFRLLDYYSNYGYANMDVQVTRNIEEHKATLKYIVIEGKKDFFGNVIITGNKKTRYTVIRRELTIKEGGLYSSRTLTTDRQKLYKLGLFTDIDIESLSRGDQKKDVLIKLKEGNAGAVEFGLGYADYEQFRGFAEVSYRNLWGMNRLGSARTELSSLEKRFILQYQEPWFMDRQLLFRAFFLSEDKKEISVPDRSVRYQLKRYALTAGVEKKLSDTVKTDLYYEFAFVTTSDVQPDVILSREDVGTLAISSIKPGIAYDTRDNPFEPSKGVLAGVSLKIASSLFLSETNFTKFTLYGSTFHRLHKRIVLAVSLRGGMAYGLGKTEDLPIVERFFLGGTSTVRGYEQDTLGPKGADGNPTGGNAFLAGNIELRTFVGRGISLVPFVDMGNVWVKVKDMDATDLKYTAGIGLRYGTPVGPIRIDYGFKLNRAPDESRDALHFSIGHAF